MDRCSSIYIYIYVSIYISLRVGVCVLGVCVRGMRMCLSRPKIVFIFMVLLLHSSLSVFIYSLIYHVKPTLCVRSVVHMQCGTVWRL